MLRSQLLLIVLILAAAASIGAGQRKRSRNAGASLPDSAFDRWVEFKGTDGKFTIRFPGVPTVRSFGDEESAGGRQKYYATFQSTIKYSVMSYEYPENLEAPLVAKDVLDSTRDAGIVGSVKAGEQPRVISETETTYEGHPARILQIGTSGGRTTWCEFVVVKHQFYFIEVVLPNPGSRGGASKNYERIAKFFINSFRLVREVA